MKMTDTGFFPGSMVNFTTTTMFILAYIATLKLVSKKNRKALNEFDVPSEVLPLNHFIF